MDVLLLGSGGREHALAWKLAQSPMLGTLYAAPGNPGIAAHARLVEIDPGDHRKVVDFCRERAIDLVVIGPEAPLVAGLADDLRKAGITVFGPGSVAAQLEGSKRFTKQLCAAAGIPTARFIAATSADQAIAALDEFTLPVVIKADGLAAGKGVVIAQTRAEGEVAITAMFGGSLGSAGHEVVIEEFLTGEEVSFFALCDGRTVMPFGSAQDHKRVGEGDTGPNTGGMGAYSPARVFSLRHEADVMARIIRPTAAALADAGSPYVGVLFAGLMLTPDGPQLIEYNCRFGDPECQVLMMRLESDLLALLSATAKGALDTAEPPRFSEQCAVNVVIAARGYPAKPLAGGTIAGIDPAKADGAQVFQAGTRLINDQLVAAGGRVLNVAATGASVTAAASAAYQAIDRISFADGFYRRDIGWREIAREASA